MMFVLFAAVLAGANPAGPPSLQQLLIDAGPDWAVIRHEASCAVENSNLKDVRWTSAPSFDRVGLQLTGQPDAKSLMDDPATILLDGSATIVPQSSVTKPGDDGKPVKSLWLNRTDFERILEAKRIKVTVGDGRELAFTSPGAVTGDLLRGCEREQMLEWGVQADQYDKAAKGPVFSGLQFFTTDDYPITSLRNEETGTVSTILTLDPAGVVKSCRVIQSSGFETLDAKSCEIMLARGRGEPARDHDGRAVDGFVFFRVRWELPSE